MPSLKTITQQVVFKASPDDVYGALMDSERHCAFTRSPASISPRASGSISAYNGHITGSNVKLSPGKEIVQRWRADDWPAGHFSTVTFHFKKQGRKTELQFTQTGVPGEFYNDIAAGWKTFYWEKMKEVFGW